MKKIIFTTFILFAGFVVFESFGPGVQGKKDGTEPGHTGSPGDSLKNCTICHGGTTTDVEGWITSNIPADGYIPGSTYTIKATNTEIGATRFGFQVSPQALNGDLLGTMVVTDTGRTQLVGDDKYITYRENGVEGVDSLSWVFDWIAPQAGIGFVTFYGAFNSNHDGHKDGDKTYLSTLVVKEKGFNSVKAVSELVNKFNVYPNPSADIVNISFEMKTPGYVTIDLLDITGKRLELIMHDYASGNVNHQFRTAGLANGIYMVRLNVDGKVSSQNITVAR